MKKTLQDLVHILTFHKTEHFKFHILEQHKLSLQLTIHKSNIEIKTL